jgi:transposase
LEVAKAMDYMLKRWDSFIRFLADGRALRGIALGRKSWLFAGSDRGGERAAVMYTLIQTAKLNDVDPQTWLADVLARINDRSIQMLDQTLPAAALCRVPIRWCSIECRRRKSAPML